MGIRSVRVLGQPVAFSSEGEIVCLLIPVLRSPVLYRQTSWVLGRSGSSRGRPTVPAPIGRRSVAAAEVEVTTRTLIEILE